jgi:aerobic carbon-monoxide dehydrogenase small subunit
MRHLLRLNVNGADYELAVPAWRTLNDVLREDLHLTGTKKGCGDGDCGACTVLLDGRSVVSCLTLALDVDCCSIVTVEGLAAGREHLHPVQEAFVEMGAIQCGFCTPGMELSAIHLLNRNPNPSDHEIRAGLSGNLCRCTGYVKIVEAIREASRKLGEAGQGKAEKP